jgi:chromosome partitioning protein
LNGLWATEKVIAPVELGEFERQQAQTLQDDIDELRETFNKEIEIAMVVPNRVDSRTKLSKSLLAEFDDEWNGLLAPASIPKSQDIRNSQRDGSTVFAREELSSTAERARESYRDNSEKLVNVL